MFVVRRAGGGYVFTRVCLLTGREGVPKGVPTLDGGGVPTLDGRRVPTLDGRGVPNMDGGGAPTLDGEGGTYLG